MGDLNNAIADAARQLTTQAGKEVPPTEVTEHEEVIEAAPENSEEITEVEEVENQPPSDDLTEEERDEAQRLYRALKDPNAAGPLIAALAQNAGILNPAKPAETPAEKRIEAKAVKDILKEGLGKEYEFLVDRLGNSIEKILEQERSAQTVQIQALEQENLVREINDSLSSLAKETKGESRKLENRMTQLMEEIKPTASTTIDSYLRRIYTIAASEKKGAPAPARNDRIRQNAADAPGRLRAASTVHETALPQKKMGLKESVEWAVEQLSKGK